MATDILNTVKGEIHQGHRRFCLHCKGDLVIGGYQVGKFYVDGVTVICPTCGHETGCFRSHAAVTLRRTEIAMLDNDLHGAGTGGKRPMEQDAGFWWKHGVPFYEAKDTRAKDQSLMDYAHSGMDAFKVSGGDDDEEGMKPDDQLEDYDESEERCC